MPARADRRRLQHFGGLATALATAIAAVEAAARFLLNHLHRHALILGH